MGAVKVAALALAGVLAASAQTDWRRIGNSAADLGLAAPATGPMQQVWFSPDGSVLYGRTNSGKVFKTLDFESWDSAADAPPAPAPVPRTPVRAPEANTACFAMSSGSQVTWCAGSQLFRSEDGRGWETLTDYRKQSVVGPGIRSVAASPADPSQLVVANDYGVWRSMDGGLTWAGLNQLLPNLPVQRILSTPAGARGTRVQTENWGVLELPPGGSVWQQAPSLTAPADKAQEDARQTYAAQLGAEGRKVEQIFVDATQPNVALAALGGDGPHVLRTVNGGIFWDDISANLPNVPAHAVTADRASGAVYVATDKGIYYAHADLQYASRQTENWGSVSSDQLPAAKAIDVLLDPSGVQLYVALEGYGVFATPAPHLQRGLRLVNAADYSARPAAPGSLVSVLGGRVNSASVGTLNYPVWNAPGTFSQIQVPFEAVGPTVSLALQTSAGTVNRELALQPVSPAILVGSDGIPALFDADSSMALDARNVAHAGQRIQIMVTGLGRVKPDWPTGLEAPLENPPAVAAKVGVSLDGNAVQVTRATLAPGYIGLYLVEVQLPVVANFGAMELHVTADGQDSNHVQIVIEP